MPRILGNFILLMLIFCSCKKKTETVPDPVSPPKNKSLVSIDAAKTEGLIKKGIIGVNQGPYAVHTPYQGYNGSNAVDISRWYTEAGISSVRLDEYANIDFSAIFPDFSKDPSDPANYIFTNADKYIKSITDIGIEVVFRLGYGETGKRNDPPSDYNKWSEVMLQVIKHYNDGWANGFHWNIRYWEIWNEPSGLGWNGTKEQYFDLYKNIAKKIKAYDPAMQVGGPSLGGPNPGYDREFAKAFIQYCSANSLPLDFFAYHVYFNDPKEHIEHALHHRQFLDLYGYTGTKLFLTEWGWLSGKNYPPTKEEVTSMEDASADVAAMIVLQDLVDRAHFYVGGGLGCCTWGLFDFFQGVGGGMTAEPRRSYFSFKAFHLLSEATNKLESSASKNIYVLSGLNDEQTKVNVLLSSYATRVDGYDINIVNLPWEGQTTCTIYMLDDKNNLKQLSKITKQAEGKAISITDLAIEQPSVCLVMMEKG